MTQQQAKLIVEIGRALIGERYPTGYKCQDFIRDIYGKVGTPLSFFDYPRFSFEEVFTERAVGSPIFLHRKATKVNKRITHMGIIFPKHQVLHYSRWMSEERAYQVLLSSLEEILQVYDFVEPSID